MPRIRDAVVVLGTVALIVRLGAFVDRWAVNVLYGDQWDFLDPLFRGEGLLAMYWRQHGPHRQGLGGLLEGLLYPLTSWNTRAEAWVALAFISASSFVYLALSRRLFGDWRVTDLIIPLGALTQLQFEMFVGAQNLAHGPIPMLLIALTAFVLTTKEGRGRSVALVALTFFSAHTGFALFNAGLVPFVLAATGNYRTALGCLAAGASTFWGYVHYPAVDCLVVPHDPFWEYFPFVTFFFGRALGTVVPSTTTELFSPAALASYLEGALLLAVCLGAAWALARRAARRAAPVVLYLSAFTLTFAAVTAVGRVCLTLVAATSSRYVPYALPGIVALYFASRAMPFPRAGRIAATALLLLSLAKERRSLPLQHEVEAYHFGKSRWVACYLERREALACEQSVGFPMYVSLQPEKVEFLEARGLSFFSDSAKAP